MGRSLRASKEGLEKAEKAFKLKGCTQEYLAGTVGCSRGTVINFFARRPVAKGLFQAFCVELGLEWGEVAELEADETPERTLNIDELIASVRGNIYGSIVEKCGFMRVLDMSQPIGLDDIYTDVNILEKITGRRRLSIPQLLEQVDIENFERFSLSGIREERVPGLQAVEEHSKLMILGKPGAGKTTFLKHLAIQCVEGRFKPKLVPLFITLKDFAEDSEQPSLLKYLTQLFVSYGVASDTKVREKPSTISVNNAAVVESFLNQGRVLVLLDGLDEVKESDSSRVLQQIQSFANQFHKNPFIITCRIAAKGYTFEQFTEVEVADFDDGQVESFATKWFQAKKDTVKAETFMERLELDRGIRELATSPILLTLLCLVFEESGTFPANRSELYKEGLDVLLKKWDVKRNIERDQVYKQLSLKRKEDLLSQVAIDTFESGNYFFKQKEVEWKINEYIRNLSGANTEEDALQLDSEAVLKSIEAQHGLLVERARGVYSFSHLTFHEYFAARKLVASSKSDIFTTQLLSHLNEKRWQEIFLLTIGMIENADDLLKTMKAQIDKLVSEDRRVKQFLSWVEQKTNSINVSYKPATVRAFYFMLPLDREVPLGVYRLDDFFNPLINKFATINGLDVDKAISTDDIDFSLDYALSNDLNSALHIHYIFDKSPNLKFTFDIDKVVSLAISPLLRQSLEEVKRQLLPVKSQKNRENFQQWWESNGVKWTEQLRAVMIQHRNIGQDWKLTPKQKALLQQYYEANQLLAACLNSDCYVSREVRQEIEDGLLVPTRL